MVPAANEAGGCFWSSASYLVKIWVECKALAPYLMRGVGMALQKVPAIIQD
jgi:hypothetical protein